MIKIKKLPKPQILVDNAETWTNEYCYYLKNGEEPSKQIATRYQNSTIKETLEKETGKKCAYCESKFKHISYGDIEHILPKNKDARPDLYVDWDNLTLACEQCNRSGKHSYYDPALPLINPYSDDPQKHLQDIGPLILPILGDQRAWTTVNLINLNRSALVEQRQERLKNIDNLLNLWFNATDPCSKKILETQLREEYGADKEYSSTVQQFLIARGFPV